MAESLDRILYRILEETRLARVARHPRARIAHYMLADSYRALANRIASDGEAETIDAAPGAQRIKRGHELYEAGVTRFARAGFLADRTA